MMRSAVLVPLALGLAVAPALCEPESPEAESQAGESPADEARARYEHVRSDIGTACQLDLQCQPPLRCVDAECSEPPSMSGEVTDSTPFVRFQTGESPSLYYLELVNTGPERQRGLMFRPWLEARWGMLFVFPAQIEHSFWMRNTYIPLDMVFIGDDCVVAGVVENAAPLTDDSRSVDLPSRYVIELNAGEAALQGIEAGVSCELVNLPTGIPESAP